MKEGGSRGFLEQTIKEWREEMKGVLEEIKGSKGVKKELARIRKEIREG